jgi:ribosomal protein S5
MSLKLNFNLNKKRSVVKGHAKRIMEYNNLSDVLYTLFKTNNSKNYIRSCIFALNCLIQYLKKIMLIKLRELN